MNDLKCMNIIDTEKVKIIKTATSRYNGFKRSCFVITNKPHDNFVVGLYIYYAFIAQRNLAERARLLTLHSSADGRIGSLAISE